MSGPVCLVVIDGLGIGRGDEGDATALADAPFLERAKRIYPNATLETSGQAVGLPRGQIGNSEIGHMTLGAGRIIDQDIVRVQQALTRSFGELLSAAGLQQLRIAETEKYAHVTYFFNGGREEAFPGEERIIVPSPRDVPTYDHKPEMSAIQVTDRFLQALDENTYEFVLLNYANPDMVGHTGIIPACVRAVEVVDACLDRLTSSVLAQGGTLLIIADHGNIEQLIDAETGDPHTAHTTNPVPIFWAAQDAGDRSLSSGGLVDVAPTLCELLGLDVPSEMTGRSLLGCDSPSSSS